MSDGISLFGSTLDFFQLETMKIRAAHTSHQGLSDAVRQVEGLFVNMMLQSMRAALPQEGLLASEQTRLYTALYDQQLAQDLTARGLGLAKALRRQLGGGRVLSPSAQSVPLRCYSGGSAGQRQWWQALGPFTGDGLPSPGGFTGRQRDASTNSCSFIARIAAPAQQVARNSGLPYHLIVAQAALESEWGAREIKTAYGTPSHNLFGIKADVSWKGESTQITTTEYVCGVMQKAKANFRVYASDADALRDYARLLTENTRYQRVVQSSSPEQAARSLQSSGYATDPHYADKLITIISQLKTLGQRAQEAYQHDLVTFF